MAYMKDSTGRRLDTFRVAESAQNLDSHLVNFSAKNLRKASAAFAKVRNGTQDMKLLCVGDSTTAGVKSSTEATFVGRHSYPRRLAELFDRNFIPSASGLVTPRGSSASIPADTRWVAGTGWTMAGWPNAYLGFGGKGAHFQGVGTTAGALVFQDPDVLADRFDVYYRRAPSSGTAGRFTATATGGSGVTADQAAVGGAPRISMVTVSAATAATTNSVSITSLDAGKNVEIVAIEPWLSTSRKVRVANAGVSGSTTADWVTFSSNNTSNDYGGTGSIKAYAPDLSIIDLGINDGNALNATVEDYITRLQIIVAAAQVSGDVILKSMIPSQASAVAAREAEYVAAARALGLPMIDQFNRVEPYADYYATGMMNVDGLHGTDLGYLDVATVVAEALRAF